MSHQEGSSCGPEGTGNPVQSGVPVSLVVIARVRFYRDGLAALFAEHGGFLVVATAAAAGSGLARVREHQPDIVLLGLGLEAGPPLVRQMP